MRLLTWTLAALALLAPACVDPQGEFDAYRRRAASTADASPPADGGQPASDAQPGDAGPCNVQPDFVEGRFLLSLSVSVAPTTPILALIEVTTPPFAGATGFSFEGQALSAADRQTVVGTVVRHGPSAVDADGAFRAELAGLEIIGAANPITGGDIAADAVLIGNLCEGVDFFCGLAEGQVSQPIQLDLQGSTFTLTRAEEGRALPSRPRINCVSDLADPL